jgi:hypothetical protein
VKDRGPKLKVLSTVPSPRIKKISSGMWGIKLPKFSQHFISPFSFLFNKWPSDKKPNHMFACGYTKNCMAFLEPEKHNKNHKTHKEDTVNESLTPRCSEEDNSIDLFPNSATMIQVKHQIYE